MAEDLLLQLRGSIAKQRPNSPQFPAYLGPWGLKQRCEQTDDPSIADFRSLLDQYLRRGNLLLEAQLLVPSKEALRELLPYCLDAVKDPDCPDVGKIVHVLTHYLHSVSVSEDEQIVLLYIIVLGYRRGDYPWRGREYADALRELIATREVPANMYADLAAWYKAVLSYRIASEVALNGAKILLQAGKTKQSASLCRDGIASLAVLPTFEFPPEEAIRQTYDEFANLILPYPTHPTFRHDPVEDSEEFQAVYDEVMEEAMKQYEEGKGPKVVQALWGYMTEGFAKRGIFWSDSQLMNPTVRFD